LPNNEKPVPSNPIPFELHSAARGPRWIAWLTRQGDSQPYQSVVIVGATREEAEGRARAWAAQAPIGPDAAGTTSS
jgi:hypothetical protein